MGASSKPENQERLRHASKAKADALAKPTRTPRTTATTARREPRTGAIGAAVLAELSEQDRSMSVAEIHAAVERNLKKKVVRDTVGSFLSVSARSRSSPVVRTGRALYATPSDRTAV